MPETWINAYRNRHFNKYDYYFLPRKQITYANDLLYTYHNADFIQEPKFAASYAVAKRQAGDFLKNYDIQWRIHVVCWAAQHASLLEGDFVDCGVYMGFCPKAIIHYVDFERLNKTYYLMDTFEGLDPKYSSAEEMKRDEQQGYKQQKNIYQYIQSSFPEKNVKLIKGSIPDTLSLVPSSKIAYLSIDMNCVLPEVAALNFFWDKMVPGGIIVLDDYGYPGCIDQKKAHDEYAESKGIKILSLPTCQGLIVKP